jgi:hypothetical protein
MGYVTKFLLLTQILFRLSVSWCRTCRHLWLYWRRCVSVMSASMFMFHSFDQQGILIKKIKHFLNFPFIVYMHQKIYDDTEVFITFFFT